MLTQEYIPPQVVLSPQDAFYGRKVRLPLEQCEGPRLRRGSSCYPPGIPILAPGERITRDVLDYITYAKAKGCNLTGPEDLHTGIPERADKGVRQWSFGLRSGIRRM